MIATSILQKNVIPYKVQCPHCDETFPKNDFYKFYLSGLDEYGVFDPQKADRSLLFNVDHPDFDDPLNKFGVDDGEGYVEDDKRWRFIGAYLVYGQWKQAILGGIRNLASAYLITGNPVYAHKAGVLLDRVADLYPTHDFGKQGLVNGYRDILIAIDSEDPLGLTPKSSLISARIPPH